MIYEAWVNRLILKLLLKSKIVNLAELLMNTIKNQLVCE